MEVIKLEEHGYSSAKYGFSLSYKDRAIDREDWWGIFTHEEDLPAGIRHYITEEQYARRLKYDKILKANTSRDKGHNKFLEHIMVWLDIEAPRYWWSEFDTYRVGVSKQSESTMHTLAKRDVTRNDFEGYPNLDLDYINERRDEPINILKGLLPESYLQRREVVLSYKVLRHIILQRHDHRLPEWKVFIDSIKAQVDHPELLP